MQLRWERLIRMGMACLIVFLFVLFPKSLLHRLMWRFGGLNVGLIEWVNCNARWHAALKALIIKSLQNIEYGFESFNSQEEGCLQRCQLNTVHADCKYGWVHKENGGFVVFAWLLIEFASLSNQPVFSWIFSWMFSWVSHFLLLNSDQIKTPFSGCDHLDVQIHFSLGPLSNHFKHYVKNLCLIPALVCVAFLARSCNFVSSISGILPTSFSLELKRQWNYHQVYFLSSLSLFQKSTDSKLYRMCQPDFWRKTKTREHFTPSLISLHWLPVCFRILRTLIYSLL